MKKYKGEWIQVARDITSGISEQDRFQRLLTTIRNMLHCDAAALLLFQQQNFIPLAINGLSEDVLGRRFNIEQHPRLEAIARAGDIVRIPSDSDLPDPYDALIPNHEQKLEVHSCIGLPLFQEDRLIAFYTKKMSAHLHLGNYTKGQANAEQCLKRFPEGSKPWFTFMNVLPPDQKGDKP